jgi:hypothetical protein
MAATITVLSEPLFTALQKEILVLLSTIDAETGAPSTSAASWVYATEPNKLRFAIDQRSRIVTNIRNNALVNVTVFAEGSVHTIYGSAQIIVDALEAVPFKLACVDITISAVRDAMFYGSRISVTPEFEKTYDKRAAEKLDGQVFDAMKKA